MTLFLHVPELEAGMDAAKQTMGTVDDNTLEATKLELIAALDAMLEFAEGNLKNMLTLMGFNSIDELNEALRNYNNLNLSLQQLFPAFSEPILTEVLARYDIGKQGGQAPQYELVASMIEDSIRRRFPEYMEGKMSADEIAKALQNNEIAASIAGDAAAQLFAGESLQANITFDLGRGTFQFGDFINQFNKIINNAKKTRGIGGTTQRTAIPFIENLLIPLIQEIGNSPNLLNDSSVEGLVDYKELENIMVRILGSKNSQQQKTFRTILNERVLRGGMRISTKTTVNTKELSDGIQITSYLDYVTCDIDKSLFDITQRGNLSIEKYVEQKCNENPEIRDKLTKRIQDFYWDIIQSYLPPNSTSPLIREKYNDIIARMCAPASAEGNIGWFFSQGTTKAGGAGMFGEIAGMIYMAILCPKLEENLRWAGGVTGEAKPPADIVLSDALKSYGVQVKNYTSGTTLSHDYALKIKNIVDEAARDNSKNTRDLMTLQAMNELDISEEEVEAVQSVIMANTFNIPYKKIGDSFQAVGSVAGFNDARNELNATYLQATRYMALISVIMHRLQYKEEVIRQISATKAEAQLQNTLWLINGSFFVSSVQILEELKRYVIDTTDRFFSISSSLKLSGDDLEKLGLKEGKFTIVEYFNYSAKGLAQTALSHVSARLTTNYKMSMFKK